jgi:succinate dehydrogenase/fumarate reductase cytochrome b subunit
MVVVVRQKTQTSKNVWPQVQAISGLFIGAFFVLHMLSHYSLLRGWNEANDTLRNMRSIYRFPLFEGLLLVSLAAHLTSNTVLFLQRRKHVATVELSKRQPLGTVERTAHRYAGYVLTLVIVGHVFATRILPLLALEDPSDYDYTILAIVYDKVPFNLFAIYLAVFGMAGNWHFVYGVRSAIATISGSSVIGKPFPMTLKVMVMGMHILLINAVIALTGYYYVIDKSAKEKVAAKLMETLGV